jgi:hypothetical protein
MPTNVKKFNNLKIEFRNFIHNKFEYKSVMLNKLRISNHAVLGDVHFPSNVSILIQS